MIKIENTEVFGWEAACRGMRNPMNSWNKSDSEKCWCDSDCAFWEKCGIGGNYDCKIQLGGDEYFKLGKNDLALMKKLSKAGNDHGKFLRMINVTCDITAPLYWWKEYDTYKVGTVANSCSTMHKIQAKEFTLEDFSHDQLLNTECDLFDVEWENGLFHRTEQPIGFLINYIVPVLNVCREKYLETKDKKYWWQMIQLLPSSYNQKRTVQLNYQVLKSMYPDRHVHKLDEWREFCAWAESLPYFKEIVLE